MAHASLVRQLAAAQTTKLKLESKPREKDLLIEKPEGDRRWLAKREKDEREEKRRECEGHLEDKVRTIPFTSGHCCQGISTEEADGELRSLRSQLMTLREQHVDLEEERSNLSRSTSQAVAGQKAQIATLSR